MAQKYHQTSQAKGIAAAKRSTLEIAPGIHIPYNLLTDSEGNPFDVQTPFPCDGDSVYTKDIKNSLSDVGTFVGADLTTLFNNLDDSIVDSSTTNPKYFKFFLERPLRAGGLGLVAKTGNFSNVKITLMDRQSAILETIDDSANNTKYTSNAYRVPDAKNVCCIMVEFYTADTITLSFLYIRKIVTVSAVIAGQSELTGDIENVRTFRGALSTSDGLRHKTGLNIPFHMPDTATTTLTVQAEVGNTSITVVSTTGFTVGKRIEIYSDMPTGELFFTITAVPGGNVITLDQPIPTVLHVGHAVEVVTTNMAVDATLVAPKQFYIAPPPGAIWQITRIIITMTDATAMDDGTFGGRTALTNGLLLRAKNDGVYSNSTLWKTNGDIANDMYDFTYISKPPAGTGYGARGRWTFTNMQAVVELNGDTSDRLEFLVQDALTDLITLRVRAQGRLYEG